MHGCRGNLEISSSILRALAAGGHFHQAGIELAEDRHEVVLGGHDFADHFVGHGHFIEAGADEGDAAFAQETVHVLPIEFLVGRFPAHVARSVSCEAESSDSAFPLPLTTKPGDAIEPGMMPNVPRPPVSRGGFPNRAARSRRDFRRYGDDAGVVRGGVLAHELHGLPIFPAFLRIEREPGEAEQLAGEHWNVHHGNGEGQSRAVLVR